MAAFSWNPFKRFSKPAAEYPEADQGVKNPSFDLFNKATSDIERVVATKSVVNQNIADSNQFANPIWQTYTDGGIFALPVASNKVERINQYRSMARFTETQWCLDEIADEFLHEDEHGNFINLMLPDGKANLNETRRTILQNEFSKYMELFNFRDDGFNLVKRFCIEGELAWENVISKDYLARGIIGVKFLPAEYYETLVDQRINKPIGIVFDPEALSRNIRDILSNNYINAQQVFNQVSPVSTSFVFNKNKCVPMLYPQITYINSGEYSDNSFVSLPMIDKTKQAYYQLTLLQDAAVILRVTRAPERLLFNISTGKMTQNYADAFVRKVAMDLKSKKVATPGGKDIASVYNPVTMLESYFFGKSDGNDGTTVESVTSSAQYDQIEDIKYFFRRYVKQWKVPYSRFETPENSKPGEDQMSQEDYSFLQMIVRMQRRFAEGFRRGYITHLKLRDIWEQYGLNESDIRVEFVRPSLYDLFNKQKIVQTKMDIYKSVVDQEELSKITCMKKFLGMTDEEITENFQNLIKEKQLVAVSDYWAAKVDENGPAGEFNKSPLPLNGDETDAAANTVAKDDDKEEESDAEDKGTQDDSASEDNSSDDTSSGSDNEPTFGLA